MSYNSNNFSFMSDGTRGMVFVFRKHCGAVQISDHLANLPVQRTVVNALPFYKFADSFSRFFELCYGSDVNDKYTFRYSQGYTDAEVDKILEFIRLFDIPISAVFSFDGKDLAAVCEIAEGHRVTEKLVAAYAQLFSELPDTAFPASEIAVAGIINDDEREIRKLTISEKETSRQEMTKYFDEIVPNILRQAKLRMNDMQFI